MQWIKNKMKNFLKLVAILFSLGAIFWVGTIFPGLLKEANLALPEQVSNAIERTSNIITQKIKQPTDPLAVQVGSDGSKLYPVQQIDLWGYKFYTSKIDGSGNVDIGSQSKQTIAKLLGAISFPPQLTTKLIIVNVDPTLINSGDQLQIPWVSGDASIDLQPKVGTYQDVYGGTVIALNNLSGYKPVTIVHELGHVIGNQLTNSEWNKYYELRGIPKNTPRRLDNWSLSPFEDFTEVYKFTFKQGSGSEWEIRTHYGILMPTSGLAEVGTPCDEIKTKAFKEYMAKNYPDDPFAGWSHFGEIDDITKDNLELQNCRESNADAKSPLSFFGDQPLYKRIVSEATKTFVRSVVTRLR